MALPPLPHWPALPKHAFSPHVDQSYRLEGTALGLTLEDATQGAPDREGEGDEEFDLDEFTRNLGRLDSILVQLQELTKAAEDALSETPRDGRPLISAPDGANGYAR